jgi:hypothetical protein
MLGLRRPRATLLPAAEPGDAPRQQRIVAGRLLLGSATMLFLELALIRWLGANVVHLSYFSNFVLLGSFLGIGLGFLISRKSWSALPFTAPLLAVTVVLALWFPVTIQRAGADVIYFTALRTTGPPPGSRSPWSSCWWPRRWPARQRWWAAASDTWSR